MNIRKATENDLNTVTTIFDDIHTAEEAGDVTIGWIRDVYPTKRTAADAIARGDLFVQEDEGAIVGTAIINQIQVDVYAKAAWQYPARDEEVMVLHTLVISPHAAGRGYGKAFVSYYEKYALAHGCHFLRMDTNERNANARALYQKLGYREVDIRPTVFNGIPGVNLVCLEKKV